MRRWALVIVAAATLFAAGLSFVLPAADAAIGVCATIRAISPDTFLNLDQTECQTVGVPTVPTAVPGVAPLPIEPPALPPVAVPPLPSVPTAPESTGEVCVNVKFDGPNTPLSGDQAQCVAVPVPALPLPPEIEYPPLPSVPLPIPALPVGLPTPIPLPIPL